MREEMREGRQCLSILLSSQGTKGSDQGDLAPSTSVKRRLKELRRKNKYRKRDWDQEAIRPGSSCKNGSNCRSCGIYSGIVTLTIEESRDMRIMAHEICSLSPWWWLENGLFELDFTRNFLLYDAKTSLRRFTSYIPLQARDWIISWMFYSWCCREFGRAKIASIWLNSHSGVGEELYCGHVFKWVSKSHKPIYWKVHPILFPDDIML